MANKKNGTIYTGVTVDLIRRIWEHRNKVIKSFTSRYDCTRLVYYELYDDLEFAISRERQIKSGPRAAKLKLINNDNPNWVDLYESIV